MNSRTLHVLLTTPAIAAVVALSGCGNSNASQSTVETPKSEQTALAQSNAAKMYTPPAEPTIKKPDLVKGIYLTAWSAGSTRKMAQVVELLEKTELNSVVIDVRDSGEMYWKTGIKLADEAKANQIAVPKPERLFETLKKHDIYPIARIACFRDNFVPKKYPDRAVQLPGGKVWKDRSGHSWLDPYNKKNWDYLADVVDFALNAGFPEIQLDYVRFPSEGKSSTQVFPGKATYEDPKALPEDVIAAFCKFIREKVKARGALLSADIFGIISSSKSDQGIGQELEKVAEPFDVLSPMVYPSHYAKGEYGIPDPNRSPYAILKRSLADYKKRLPNKNIRPWLQDFSLFGVHYGVPEILAQIKAAKEQGYNEFLMWNAGNHYTTAAYIEPKKGETKAAKPVVKGKA